MKTFDRVILFDLDRTIFDSNKFVIDFDRFLRQKINPEIELKQVSDKVANNFDFLAYLDQFGVEVNQDLTNKFRRFSNNNYWLDSAKEVILQLMDLGETVTVLSYGKMSVQAMKLRLLDLNLELIVTDSHDKGKLISGWRQSGLYKVPFNNESINTKKLILIDDKQTNLDNLPDDCLGLHFSNKSTYKNQISDLNKILELLH